MRDQMKLSEERDLPLLKLLWKWKVASTSVIATKFFSGSSLDAAYLRLWRLERGGYIEAVSSTNGRGFVWTLTKKGYEIGRPRVELAEEGFRSENIGHDIVVTAVHLGEWLIEEPTGVELLSEQEMRRYDVGALPDWLCDIGFHRPDGFWRIPSGAGQRLVALEVELSQKKLETYEEIARFYEEDAGVNQVIWVVDGATLLKRINERIEKAIDGDVNRHSFISFSDYQKDHWQSKVIAGKDRGHSLHRILDRNPIDTRKVSISSRFFDLRKNPKNPDTSTVIYRHNFFNCVAPLSKSNPQRNLSE